MQHKILLSIKILSKKKKSSFEVYSTKIKFSYSVLEQNGCSRYQDNIVHVNSGRDADLPCQLPWLLRGNVRVSLSSLCCKYSNINISKNETFSCTVIELSLQYGILILLVLVLECVAVGLAFGLKGDVSSYPRYIFHS